MRLRDKIFNKNDIVKYKGLAAMANMKIRKDQDKWLVPTFIIEEAINYFCGQEKYEVCANIRKFFQLNPAYVTHSSKEQWYQEQKRKV